MNARVAILMTVYNGGAYVHDAVSSLLGQSFEDFILHVVNDGSTDRSGDLLHELARSDARLIIYEKDNTGIVDSLNFGLERIEAEYIARADADDLSSPDRLAVQVAYLDAHPDVLAVSGRGRQIDGQGRFLGTFTHTDDPGLADPYALPAQEPYLMQPFLLVRASALKAAGGYRPLPVSEDSDLFWRLSERGRLVSLDQEFGSYRLNPDSISSRSLRNGRLMAACSQLAAISARRRREGREDIVFSERLVGSLFSSSDGLKNVAAACAPELTREEGNWFEAAISAKLLEMAGYRPYELEGPDTSFIARALRSAWPALSVANRRMIRRMCAGTAARLLAGGRRSSALALLPLAGLIPTAVRWLARVAVAPEVYRRLRGRVVPGGELQVVR